MPIGFIAGQLQTERALAPLESDAAELPSGFVTMLMTDIEGSTSLVQRVDAHFPALIEELWAKRRSSVLGWSGYEVEARADEFFAVKSSAPDGVRFRILGEYHLRGLAAPVALYQIGAGGLPARFPPLRTS